MNDHVILLHGLWMRGFTLAALRRRLEATGFSVELYDYASVLRGPEIGVENLIKRAQASQAAKVHFVGHSLGGLVALQALQRAPKLTRGRVVCLGSPLRGSALARTVGRFPGGSLVIGKSLDILTRGLDRWEGKQAVGAIAGRLPIGFGFGALTSPHDGTVSVAETQLPDSPTIALCRPRTPACCSRRMPPSRPSRFCAPRVLRLAPERSRTGAQ